ncbi:hypothetical protein GUITHDRAFT_138575 [Guillardia theta CCMP2712]|uniref:Uncharacterized protein n=1 Tax=Guillardia theta (strain CCMP2712) TaxID=905079 RepID=L1JC56_GUITC|nr:hypothetical protein GUITHDRAFT_138575 [Guillardia theta CCMP2712]EKX46106.1 hypothetical protein GUITHDRAFT_138575 [Guillardia theta CCMP2712]|eukprot:XP_005833086.1 hypothetical protein GUITHDRAFT_138575 [Guillardia theta CCMP2712]
MDEDFWSFIDGVLPSDVCDCMAVYGHDHHLVISQEEIKEKLSTKYLTEIHASLYSLTRAASPEYSAMKILHGLRKLSGVMSGRVVEHLDLNLFKKLLEVYKWMEFNSPKARCACEYLEEGCMVAAWLGCMSPAEELHQASVAVSVEISKRSPVLAILTNILRNGVEMHRMKAAAIFMHLSNFTGTIAGFCLLAWISINGAPSNKTPSEVVPQQIFDMMLELLSASVRGEEFCGVTWNLKDILRRVETLFELDEHRVTMISSGMIDNLVLVQQKIFGRIDEEETETIQGILIRANKFMQTNAARGDHVDPLKAASNGQEEMSLQHMISSWVRTGHPHRELATRYTEGGSAPRSLHENKCQSIDLNVEMEDRQVNPPDTSPNVVDADIVMKLKSREDERSCHSFVEPVGKGARARMGGRLMLAPPDDQAARSFLSTLRENGNRRPAVDKMRNNIEHLLLHGESHSRLRDAHDSRKSEREIAAHRANQALSKSVAEVVDVLHRDVTKRRYLYEAIMKTIRDVIHSSLTDDHLASPSPKAHVGVDYYVEKFNAAQRDTRKVLVRKTRSGLTSIPVML